MDHSFQPDKMPKTDNLLEGQRILAVKQTREKFNSYIDQISQFGLMTASKNAGGFFETNTDVKMVHYDSEYKSDYECNNLEGFELASSAKTGYIYDKSLNKVTFQGYLGRTLHTPDRDGNGLFVTLKFNKGFDPREILQSVNTLFETLKPFAGNDKSQNRTINEDLVDISKETAQVLEAFKEISEKFPSNGRISVQSMIDEYQKIIDPHTSV